MDSICGMELMAGSRSMPDFNARNPLALVAMIAVPLDPKLLLTEPSIVATKPTRTNAAHTGLVLIRIFLCIDMGSAYALLTHTHYQGNRQNTKSLETARTAGSLIVRIIRDRLVAGGGLCARC